MQKDPLVEQIIACAVRVHAELGPGFGEKVYQKAFKIELEEHGLKCSPERNLAISFRGKRVGRFRLDFVVEGQVIVETKAVRGYTPKVFESQVLSYLKASGHRVGLLINFGNRSCEVKRITMQPT